MSAVSFANLKCFDCDFGSHVETDLATHCGATGHRKRWLCVPCMTAFNSERDFTRHCQTLDVPSHRYCALCNILFHTLPVYHRHRVDTHGLEMPDVLSADANVECEVGREEWEATLSEEKEDIEESVEGYGEDGMHHNGREAQDADRDKQKLEYTTFKCFDCEFGCCAETELTEHCDVSEHRKRWLCLPCMAAIPSEIYLAQHRRDLDVPAHRYCNPCNILFSTLGLFVTHCVAKHDLVILQGSSRAERMEGRDIVEHSETVCLESGRHGEEKVEEADEKGLAAAAGRKRRGLGSVGSFEYHLRFGILPTLGKDHDIAQTLSVVEQGHEPKLGPSDYRGCIVSSNSMRACSIAWNPEPESPEQPGDTERDMPHRRYCSLCNIYFESVGSFEIHEFKAHAAVQFERKVQEALVLTCQLRAEQVDRLKQEIELAEQEEMEQQETLNEHERVRRQEQSEKWERAKEAREECIREDRHGGLVTANAVSEKTKKRKKRGNELKRRVTGLSMPSLNCLRQWRERNKVPSIQIRAILPFYRIDPPPSLVPADRYCQVCRHTFQKARKCAAHKLKVHQDMQKALSMMCERSRRNESKKLEKMKTGLKRRPACPCSDRKRPSLSTVDQPATVLRAGGDDSERGSVWTKRNSQRPQILKGLGRTERQSRKRDKGRWGDQKLEKREWYRETQEIRNRKERDGGPKWSRFKASGSGASAGTLRDEMRRERKRKPKRVVLLTEFVPYRQEEHSADHCPTPWISGLPKTQTEPTRWNYFKQHDPSMADFQLYLRRLTA